MQGDRWVISQGETASHNMKAVPMAILWGEMLWKETLCHSTAMLHGETLWDEKKSSGCEKVYCGVSQQGEISGDVTGEEVGGNNSGEEGGWKWQQAEKKWQIKKGARCVVILYIFFL